jgi:hypothetical protein
MDLHNSAQYNCRYWFKNEQIIQQIVIDCSRQNKSYSNPMNVTFAVLPLLVLLLILLYYCL